MTGFKGSNDTEQGSGPVSRFTRIKVFTLGCPPLFVQGLRLTLEKSGEFEVVGEAESYLSAFKQMELLKPDIVILDCSASQSNTSKNALLAKQNFPIKIIVLSSNNQDEQFLEALKLGAVACLPLKLSPERLLEALRRIARGSNLLTEMILSKPKLVDQLIEQFRDFASSLSLTNISRSDLTNREMEVLRRVAHGDSNKEIARDLCISDQTVKNHIGSIFRKLNVDSRTRAVLIAFENGWFQELPETNSSYQKYNVVGGNQFY